MSQKAVEIEILSPNLPIQAQQQPARPSLQHRRLEVFVGKWNVEGEQHNGPFGPAATLTAAETYEWLAGGFFLVHRLEGRLGDDELGCLEIIGYEALSQSYPMHSFYNDGNINQWQASEHYGTWTFTGDWRIAGKSLKIRCTTVFSNAGNSKTGKWEYASDDLQWQTFWDVKATREMTTANRQATQESPLRKVMDDPGKAVR
jgi:hypothetical protein